MASPEKSKALEWYNKFNYATIAVGLLGVAAGLATANPALINASALAVGVDAGTGYAVNKWAENRKNKKTNSPGFLQRATVFQRK